MDVDQSTDVSAVRKGDLPDYVIQERIDLQKDIFLLRQHLPDHITKRVKDSVLLAQKQEKDNGLLQAAELHRAVDSQLAKSKLKRPVEQYPRTVTFDDPTSTDGVADSPVILAAKLSARSADLQKCEENTFAQLDLFHQHILRTFPQYFKNKVDH